MFIRHTACPKCKANGRDTRGNNLAIYENGEHCFSCGNGKKYKQEKREEKQPTVFQWELTNELPVEWHEFLDEYGISGYVRKSYFRYCPDLDRLIFIINEFVEARSFDKEPKVLSWGRKPLEIFWGWPDKGSSLIFVEDVFSAMIISNIHSCACLFGSQWLKDWEDIIERYDYHPIFWLDKDKLDKAREYRDMFRSRGRSSTLIFTPKDPKYYLNYQIKEFVTKAVDSLSLPKLSLVSRWNPIETRMERVPSNSVRARLWLDHRPEYIAEDYARYIPANHVIRFNKVGLMYAPVGGNEYYHYPLWPMDYMGTDVPTSTKFNNNELAMEENEVKKPPVKLDIHTPPGNWYVNEPPQFLDELTSSGPKLVSMDEIAANVYAKNWEASYQKLKKSLGSNTQTTNKNKPTKINKPNTST